MSKPKFSRESFKQWLQKQSHNKRFKGGHYKTCPIGRYNAAFGRERWFAVNILPLDWSWIFISTFDKKQSENPNKSFSPKQCLAILKEIPNA